MSVLLLRTESRPVCGIRKTTLIANLPGSKKASQVSYICIVHMLCTVSKHTSVHAYTADWNIFFCEFHALVLLGMLPNHSTSSASCSGSVPNLASLWLVYIHTVHGNPWWFALHFLDLLSQSPQVEVTHSEMSAIKDSVYTCPHGRSKAAPLGKRSEWNGSRLNPRFFPLPQANEGGL